MADQGGTWGPDASFLVDKAPDPSVLVRAMDELAGYPAVHSLRRLTEAAIEAIDGRSVCDVGCGTGDVVIDLARLVGPTGSVTGIDHSEVMLAEATRRVEAAGVADRVSLRQGDAAALDVPDASFDACRAERTLQHVGDPAAALREMVRVVRPGGWVAVIDTDWETATIDHPDGPTTRRILNHFTDELVASGWVGRQLVRLAESAGLDDVSCHPATLVQRRLDEASAQREWFKVMATEAARAGAVDADDAARWLAFLDDAVGREFFASVTMFAVTGRKSP